MDGKTLERVLAMALKPLKVSKSGEWKGGPFPSGEKHPKVVPWPVLEERIDQLQLNGSMNGLTIVKNTYQRRRGYRLIDAVCSYCQKRKTYYLDNLLRGVTKACVCQRNRKYGGDPRADRLGQRYDAMVQRCNRDTHVSSHRYKGRDIRVLFSREQFIRWALSTFPDKGFKGLDFDRIDNEGDYSLVNLRLVTRRVNLLNRDSTVLLSFKGQVMPWAEWPSPYSPRRTQALAAKGLTGEQIIAKALQAVREKRKSWQAIAERLQTLGYVQSVSPVAGAE